MRIAVDAMGGDHAPARIVDGALAAARHLGIGVDLVGPAGRRSRQRSRGTRITGSLDIRVIDAPDVIGMAESPAQALRRKPRASIRVAAELVAGGDAAALVSAGHTGAVVVAAHATFGMLPGVDRPGLAPSVPTRGGSAVLIDAGATVECKPSHLLQFGVMGSVYARTWLGIERPRVGPAVHRRRRNQGQRADARSPSAAERRHGCTSSATSRRATSSRGRPT